MSARGTRRVSISDVEALQDALGGDVTVASPLRAGASLLDLIEIGLGDVVLWVGRNSPLLVQGVLPDHRACAVLPLAPDRPVLLNGRPVGPHSLAVYGAGALHEGASHDEARWAVLALHTAMVNGLLELPRGSPIFRRGTHVMLDCDPATRRQTASLLQSAADVALSDPAVFEVEEARRSLRASLLESLQDLLTGAWGGRPPRVLRPLPGRQRIVRAAEDYLRANPGGAGTTAEVAAALGISASRLQQAMRSTFGIGPQRYLHLRRLTMLRNALRTGAPGVSPQDIALAHGFWAVDRLARDYRDLFAEEPAAAFERNSEIFDQDAKIPAQ